MDVLPHRPHSMFISWSGGLIRVCCRACSNVMFVCEDFVRAVVGDMAIMAVHENRKKCLKYNKINVYLQINEKFCNNL